MRQAIPLHLDHLAERARQSGHWPVDQPFTATDLQNARLAAIESRLARFEREHLSNSNPLSSTGDSSPS